MAVRLDFTLVEERLKTRYVGRNLLYLTRATSTQDVARVEAERNAPEGTAVLAEEQTGGRGRLGRSWVSPAGKNLYLTLVMRPPARRLRVLSIVAPLAMAEALEDAAGLTCRIKWPNDILVGGRKIAGVLIETDLAGEAVKYALVGMGVNVNFDPAAVPEIADIATSVRRELGRDGSREEVLAALLNAFETRYTEAQEGDAAFRAWRSRLETLGQRVRATLAERVEEGVAEDVDAEGSLIIRRDDGSLVTVEAGDVTLRV
ncbi:MAG: biotin--[acetyl-CoA-carboxylase] ligase [Dehalococcoidia bacterium]|nr:MAG: biotin--[acetyl-CoA-carboxylase] ligase [Dehalococcoidia bacterium]